MIHSKYRAFARQGALTVDDIESPELPAGCYFSLDEVTQKQVLKKIRESLRMNKNALPSTPPRATWKIYSKTLQSPIFVPLVVDFINHYGLGLPHIYGRSSEVTLPGVTKPVATTWTSLQAASGLYPDLVIPSTTTVSVETNKRVKALTHVHDTFRINAYLELLNTDILEQDMTDEQRRHAWMLLFSIWPKAKWDGSTKEVHPRRGPWHPAQEPRYAAGVGERLEL